MTAQHTAHTEELPASSTGELTREDILRLHPGWEVRQEISQMYTAWLRSSPEITVTGEDLTDVNDLIRRAKANLPMAGSI